MKKSVLIINLLLMSSFLFSCTQGQAEPVKEDEGPKVVEGQYIIENGVSTYYVVLAKNPQNKEVVASQEFTYFMKNATGCSIPITNEKELKSGTPYISLGVTTQFKDAFPDYDYSQIDNTQSTYFIATKENNIYIVSSDDYRGDGVLYGVYDLLHDLIDYTYYHETEIYYKTTDKVNLYDYGEKIVRPSFDLRSISSVCTYTNELHNQRLRLVNNSRGYEWCRGCYGHGQIGLFVGPWMIGEDGVRYGESHPEWFVDPDGKDPGMKGTMIDNCLNWCAGEELERVVANKMVQFIIDEPDAKFYMCAQEDTNTVCKDLPGVQEALNSWAKGSYTALQINFINHVIELTEEMLKERLPEKTDTQYLIFAYGPTLQAPIDSDGNIIIKPHEKLRILMALIHPNYSVSFSSPLNKEFMQILQGWKKVAYKQIIMYLYDLNYRYYLVNYNNFGSVTGMYRECLEAGVSYLLTQGVSDSNNTCFEEMRHYVEANLLWNVNLEYDVLALDFMKHFYKQGYEKMWELYNAIRNNYAYQQGLVDPSTGSTTGFLPQSTLYPLEFVRQLDILIHEALDAIAELEAIDNEQYTLLKNRIMREYISVIYLKLKLYRAHYSEAEQNEMIELFNYYTNLFGITHPGEGADMSGVFN